MGRTHWYAELDDRRLLIVSFDVDGDSRAAMPTGVTYKGRDYELHPYQPKQEGEGL